MLAAIRWSSGLLLYFYAFPSVPIPTTATTRLIGIRYHTYIYSQWFLSLSSGVCHLDYYYGWQVFHLPCTDLTFPLARRHNVIH